MKNVDDRVPDARLLKEWALRLTQLRNRAINLRMSTRIGQVGEDASKEVQRRIDAALRHLRKFDWEKKR